MTKQKLREQLIQYAANDINDIDVGRELTPEQDREKFQLMSEYTRVWECEPCDAEGATKKQEAVFNEILDHYANEFFRLFV